MLFSYERHWEVTRFLIFLPSIGLAFQPIVATMMIDYQLIADTALGLWGQTFSTQDLVIVLLLIFFEGVLSIDNAIVLGLLAKRLPKSQQKRALTYGLVGAFVFRTLAIITASFLLEWRIVKLLGGGYLLYIALKHLFFQSKEEGEETLILDADGQPSLRDAVTGEELTDEQQLLEIEERLPIPADTVAVGKHFWMTVAVIELTDIAFAVDSILAAIALVGSPPADHPVDLPHPKLWVVILGGILGIILMRIAAAIFIKLLEKFPRFETAAYLLVAVIGLKLLADWGLNSVEHPHVVDFHNFSQPEFWIFWISMLLCLGVGFLPKREAKS
jgi:YkoY family integral membrane protein